MSLTGTFDTDVGVLMGAFLQGLDRITPARRESGTANKVQVISCSSAVFNSDNSGSCKLRKLLHYGVDQSSCVEELEERERRGEGRGWWLAVLDFARGHVVYYVQVRVAPGWSRVISQDASSSVVLALHQPEDSRDPPPNWLPLTGPVVVEWERRLPHFRNGPRPRVI